MFRPHDEISHFTPTQYMFRLPVRITGSVGATREPCWLCLHADN